MAQYILNISVREIRPSARNAFEGRRRPRSCRRCHLRLSEDLAPLPMDGCIRLLSPPSDQSLSSTLMISIDIVTRSGWGSGDSSGLFEHRTSSLF